MTAKKKPGRPAGTARFTEFLSLRVEPEMHREISAIAEAEDRPVMSMTRVLLMRGLAEWKREHTGRRGRGVRKGPPKG